MGKYEAMFAASIVILTNDKGVASYDRRASAISMGFVVNE
jgi:hypothetical protein